MTTSTVVSVTDELIAELEDECRSGVDVYTPRGIMRALLAERAELKRDAERYRFWRYMATHEPAKMARILAYYETSDQLDAAIDAAMEASQ